MAARLTKAEIDKLNKEFNSLSEDNAAEYKRKKKIWSILNFNKRPQAEASPKISDKKLTRLSESLRQKSLASPKKYKHTASGLEPRSLSKIEIPSRVWPQKKHMIKSPIGWEGGESPSYDEQEMTGPSDGSMNLSREAVQRNLESQKNVDETGHTSPAQKSWEKKRSEEQSPERALLEAEDRGDILSDLMPDEREAAEAAIRKRQRATNEGTTKDGPLTKEEAINSLRGGLKKGSGDKIPEQTEFSDDEGGFLLADQMGRAGKKISMDEFEQAKIKREQMADYIKMMQGDKRAEDARRFPYRDDFYTPPEKTEKEAIGEMVDTENKAGVQDLKRRWAEDDRRIKEERAARKKDERAEVVRKSQFRDDYFAPPEKTEKQATDEMGMDEYTAQKQADEKRQLREMVDTENVAQREGDATRQWQKLAHEDRTKDRRMKGIANSPEERGLMNMADWEMLNEMNTQKAKEKRDSAVLGGRGRGPTKQEMHELRGEAGENVNFDEAMYNISQQVDPMDPRAIGGDRMTDLKPTSKNAEIEEINIKASELNQALDDENVPREERARIKEQAGNYFIEPVTGLAINLDRLNASIDDKEKRADMFKVAGLLKGKALEKFLIRNELIDKGDIPEKTALEKEQDELTFVETQIKLVEAGLKAKKLEEGPFASEESKYWIERAEKVLKDDPTLARAFYKKAGLTGLPKADTDSADKALIRQGFDFSNWVPVAGKDGKHIGEFMSNYWKQKAQIDKEVSMFKWAPPGGLSIDDRTKMIPHFDTAGILMWDKIPGVKDGSGTITKDKLGFIKDSNLRDKISAATPDGGYKNETEWIQGVSDIVVNTALDNIFDGFHTRRRDHIEYNSLLSKPTKGQGGGGGERLPALRELDLSGKTYGTGSIEGQTGPIDVGFTDPKTIVENLEKKEPPKITEEAIPLEIKHPREQMVSAEASNAVGNVMEAEKLKEEKIKLAQQRAADRNEKKKLARISSPPFDNQTLSNEAQDAIDQAEVSSFGLGSNLQASTLSSVSVTPLQVNDENGNPDARATVERQENYQFTYGNEGFQKTPSIERYEDTGVGRTKKKGAIVKDSKGRPVWHIGVGTKLPLSKKEVKILKNTGMSDKKLSALTNPNPNSVKDVLKTINLDRETATLLSKFRYKDHIDRLIKVNPDITFSTYRPEVRRVLFDLAYNIGPEFMTRKTNAFEDFKKEFKARNIEGMIEQIKDSDYYRSQNRNRANKNIKILEELL